MLFPGSVEVTGPPVPLMTESRPPEPVTTTPVLAVLSVQPTRLPWSARHAQTSSMIEWPALSCRLTVAPTFVLSAPPMRKKTSWIRSGSPVLPEAGAGVPTESRTGEVTGPASMMSPESFTPRLGTTIMAGLPRCGTRVAKPCPSTTVSGWLTTMG
jgi:hypothetical protein